MEALEAPRLYDFPTLQCKYKRRHARHPGWASCAERVTSNPAVCSDMFPSVISVLIRLSVTAADSGTLDTDHLLVRGCLHGNSRVKRNPGHRTGIHADHLIVIEGC